jgi:tetratricopeptide (TPR) repeat protein
MAQLDSAFLRWLLTLALSLSAGLNVGAAQAETASTEAMVEARRSDAKQRYQRGVEQYRAGRYAEAVAAFLEADRLAPSPALSFNIARAYERLDDTSGALRWYRDYLRRNPNAKNAAGVKERIAALAARLAQTGLQQLSVLSTPDGATVLVDGQAVGATPFTGELAPGRHLVLIERQGYRQARHEIVLAPSTPTELNVSLEPEPRRASPALAGERESAPNRDSDRAGNRRFGVLPWFIAGTGMAGLGGAVGFELARRSEERAARGSQSQLEYKKHLDNSLDHQTRARVLVGVGGGLLVTGSVMLLFNDRAPNPTRVALACTARGCAATAKGSFF